MTKWSLFSLILMHCAHTSGGNKFSAKPEQQAQLNRQRHKKSQLINKSKKSAILYTDSSFRQAKRAILYPDISFRQAKSTILYPDISIRQ
jgi:hypothetical protein